VCVFSLIYSRFFPLDFGEKTGIRVFFVSSLFYFDFERFSRFSPLFGPRFPLRIPDFFAGSNRGDKLTTISKCALADSPVLLASSSCQPRSRISPLLRRQLSHLPALGSPGPTSLQTAVRRLGTAYRSARGNSAERLRPGCISRTHFMCG
jgi:hypothetical protein